MSAANHFRKRSMSTKQNALRDPCKTTRHYRQLESMFVSMCHNSLFRDISIEGDNDWIVRHYSDEQTFQDWNRIYSVVKSSKSTIYIQPLGPFAGNSLLNWLKSYCSVFFYGVKVCVLPAVPISNINCRARVNGDSGQWQIRATDVIDYLKKTTREHAICTVAVTMVDLYPKESWNFVFGLASLTSAVGVFSFARYTDTFYHPSPTAGDLDNPNFPDVTGKLLFRACKVMTHEICHMFGIKHCVYWNCAMNGSNHLSESDRRVPNLCPICLRKLQEALKFDLIERYNKMQAFTRGELTEGSPPLQDFTEFNVWLKHAVTFLQKKNYDKQINHRPR